MIRNLKALGLALSAVFMFGALSTSAVSATTNLFTSPVEDTYITGAQIGGVGAGNVFFSTKWEPEIKIECATAAYTGTFLGASAEKVEVTPSYTGCKLAGVILATIHDEGCKFVLTGVTDKYTSTEGKEEGEAATVSLNCADTGQIRITTGSNCKVTISDTHPASNKVNQNLLGVKYDNELDANGNKWDVKATVTVDKITYTSNAACQSVGITATGSDGFLTTTMTLKGYSNAAHTNQVNLTTS